jgi:cbb3-type cytochrome c oxidase subunit II
MDKQNRIPAHLPRSAPLPDEEPRRYILMTPLMAGVGGMLAFLAVVFSMVILPTNTYNPPPSDNWAPLTDDAVDGRSVFLANGCVYCHSGFTRPQDVAQGLYYLYPRVSEPGDYYGSSQSPNVLGSERTGPDLSQEGGNHPDGWHRAHYNNPRNTMPLSIMPRFNFLSDQELTNLIAFNQAQGGKDAYLRDAALTVGQNLMLTNMGVYQPEDNFPDLVQRLQDEGVYRPDGKPMDTSPSGLPWMAVWMMNSFERGYWLTSNPLPVTEQNLLAGKQQFLKRCVGCHGIKGDGGGPAAQYLDPNPFNFTATGMTGMTGPFASDGQLYYRILTGGKGTAMENFGTRLSVEDTWRIVLFLRTIPNGSLATPDTVPTVDMWEQWTPPEPMLNYIDEHPIQDGAGSIANTQGDPFAAAAHWVAPGMAPGDEIYVGGKLPITPELLRDLIRQTYMDHLQRAYNEATARGEDVPAQDAVMSTEGLTFHAP